MILVDTNVLLSATFEIEDQEAALALLGGEPLVTAPSLWRYEFVSVVTRQARLGHVTFREATAGYRLAEGFVTRTLAGEDLPEVVDLSRRYTCSGRDAVFLYWAAALQTPLVTRDRRLARAAPHLTRLLTG